MDSALYTGRLRHRRHGPVPHAFEYRLFMVWLNLAELDEVFRGRWLWSAHRPTVAWLRRADYLGDHSVALECAVRDRVEHETGARPAGPIRLLTHLRCFGHCFNPVSFYYCYDAADTRVETIVAEITNTPWNERHAYVLPARLSTTPGRRLRFGFRKSFHVSPFMPMDIDYDWRFPAPGPRIAVHMLNRRNGATVFDATLSLERREISGTNLALVLARYPFSTLRVVGAIYWQALRLWALRTPFHPHPARQTDGKTSV